MFTLQGEKGNSSRCCAVSEEAVCCRKEAAEARHVRPLPLGFLRDPPLGAAGKRRGNEPLRSDSGADAAGPLRTGITLVVKMIHEDWDAERATVNSGLAAALPGARGPRLRQQSETKVFREERQKTPRPRKQHGGSMRRRSLLPPLRRAPRRLSVGLLS